MKRRDSFMQLTLNMQFRHHFTAKGPIFGEKIHSQKYVGLFLKEKDKSKYSNILPAYFYLDQSNFLLKIGLLFNMRNKFIPRYFIFFSFRPVASAYCLIKRQFRKAIL